MYVSMYVTTEYVCTRRTLLACLVFIRSAGHQADKALSDSSWAANPTAWDSSFRSGLGPSASVEDPSPHLGLCSYLSFDLGLRASCMSDVVYVHSQIRYIRHVLRIKTCPPRPSSPCLALPCLPTKHRFDQHTSISLFTFFIYQRPPPSGRLTGDSGTALPLPRFRSAASAVDSRFEHSGPEIHNLVVELANFAPPRRSFHLQGRHAHGVVSRDPRTTRDDELSSYVCISDER